ncbi:Metallo-dependent phosphatase-like protein [Schizophyllum amplum]|uniref:Metallo-dependent phosphatase-like protein n=1 Tax=Schizophyllum amplum TaxID=97359 RepID=A0A550C3J8_9AGAR|nr:Metallo-dependent phosphatase-like protein [Auriculariopsis ampla]
MSTKLHILQFNDVYRVQPQKLAPGSSDTIDVTQFAAMLDDLRQRWAARPDGKRDGLVLFSGDVFAPSVESSVTRGSHMVPVMNEIAPDISLTGNHDFDFGYPHLSKLIEGTNFPWLLSNIVDKNTGSVPAVLREFWVFERCGLRIGIVGLVEKEWIGTVAAWPANFVYKDMAEVGLDLSRKLRDPDGEHKCDIVLALTHARIPNDISLAKALHALSPSEQARNSIAEQHGVDILFGGHDHLYYISKGVSSWEDYDVNENVLGAEADNGDVLVVKSGTDFRDLSELTLELVDTPPGSIRKKVITNITGKRHSTKPGSRSSERLQEILNTVLSSITKTLKAPLCKTSTLLDCRSQYVRVEESAAGNWFADVIRHAYDDSLCMKGGGGADLVLICGGTIRGDSQYGPGVVTLGDILEILPFEDPIIVLELDGQAIWDALEAGFSTWPAQEGRFPIVSGIRVSWDSRREPGKRVLGIWLQNEMEDGGEGGSESGRSTPKLVDGEPIKREQGGRMYKVVSREYMAQGHDGFTALKGQKYLVDDENGQLMSTIVRKYLLGSHFVNRMSHVVERHPSTDGIMHQATLHAITRERHHRERQARDAKPENKVITQWKHAIELALKHRRPKAHYREQFNVSGTEHMSGVDVYDGKKARAGQEVETVNIDEEDPDLLVVSPVVDGRMKDVGRN